MILLDLFIGFLKVGCFSFGGAYAAIPLIRDVVLSYGWLDDEMLSYMIAVSESTPGPIMVNIATYVGFSQAGIPGAALATLAVILPAFFIVLLLTAFLTKASQNPYVQALLSGIKPAIIGIILVTGITMIAGNIYVSHSLQLRAFLITGILAIIYFGRKLLPKIKITPIQLICISAVLGMIVYAI